MSWGGKFTQTQCKVTAINRVVGEKTFSTTNGNIEGESGGGGVFSNAGMVGVIQSRDIRRDEGLDASLYTIYKYLQKIGMEYLIKIIRVLIKV